MNKISQPITIAHVLCALETGGAERLVSDLIRFSNKNQCRFLVCTVMGGGALEKDLQEQGIQYLIGGRKSKSLGIRTILKLARFFKKERVQIVHTHLWAGDTWGRLAALLAGVPIIISTEHNINLDERFYHRLTKRLLSYQTEKIIAISQAVKEFSIQTDKIPASEITVIYNGINLDKFTPIPPFPPKQTSPTLITTGRLTTQKGHCYLLEALPQILEKFPACQLKILGEGKLKGPLISQTKRLKIEKSVHFSGKVDNVAEVLKKADVFVFPSLWEGLGIAVLEAMACAKPVIASHVGGIPEIVEDQKTGILVPPKNPEKIAQAILELLQNPPKARDLGQKGLEKVQDFSIQKTVQEYESLYKNLLSVKK